MACVSVLWHVQRVGHRVMLSLQADLYNLHRSYDGDRFRDTSAKTGCGRERGGRERGSQWPGRVRAPQELTLRVKTSSSPRKIPALDGLSALAGVSQLLYLSKEANRMAIFGTMPVMTAPRPGRERTRQE